MRYYQVVVPGDETETILSSVKDLRDLPDGTVITAIVTERDGTVCDSWNIPIVDGKPVITKGISRPKYHGLT